MSKRRVLIEVQVAERNAFDRRAALAKNAVESARTAEDLIGELGDFDIEVNTDIAPVPLFSQGEILAADIAAKAAFDGEARAADVDSESTVVAAEMPENQIAELQEIDGVEVWPDAELEFISETNRTCGCGQFAPDFAETGSEDFSQHPLDLARSSGGVDCRPFRPGATIETIRDLLSVEAVWRDGFRGQNVVVAIVDDGVNGAQYPVVGGFGGDPRARPGSARITSHGSMCAADVLVAAPAAKLYDYPIMNPFASSTLDILQQILEQRRIDGTPQVINNSWGFSFRPQNVFPRHPNWNPNHPVNRKFGEVIESGATVLFAAGNCGPNCPSGRCDPREVELGGITGPASLEDVICVAAVNSRHERVGYSSQGPGEFTPQKPDIAGYTHLFGNFGTGRPGGTRFPFDNGTSAATPVAAGVVALLISAIPETLTPNQIMSALKNSAIDLGVAGWDADTGRGVLNAATAYAMLQRSCQEEVISDSSRVVSDSRSPNKRRASRVPRSRKKV